MSSNVTNYEDFITIISDPIMEETCKKPPPRLLWTRVCVTECLWKSKNKCGSELFLSIMWGLGLKLGPSGFVWIGHQARSQLSGFDITKQYQKLLEEAIKIFAMYLFKARFSSQNSVKTTNCRHR